MAAMSARLETLKQMIAQDPGSSFIRYGLAMELMNLSRPQDAIEQFRTLMDSDPAYVATYFQAGRAAEMLGMKEDARAIYLRGIDACANANDDHARSELEGALSLLGG